MKAIIKTEDAYKEAFMLGYTPNVTDNPYLLTSNMSDCFVLGRHFAFKGYPAPKEIKKSRGYTWKVDGAVIRVDGLVVSSSR